MSKFELAYDNFTPDSLEQFRALDHDVAKKIVHAFNRIGSGNTSFDDIVELREAPGVYRWKPSSEIYRVCEKHNVRVIFRRNGSGNIEILRIASRKKAYRNLAALTY